jgi:hypothetical protein
MNKVYNCLFCNKENAYDLHHKTNKYCDAKCQSDFQNLQRLNNWKATGNTARVAGTPGWLKKYILEKQNGKCTECGISEWNSKPIVFDLEHKDGDSSNNLEENLCCMCPNCHSQTSTYKGKNKGNGRHSRRERYAAGKSF